MLKTFKPPEVSSGHFAACNTGSSCLREVWSDGLDKTWGEEKLKRLEVDIFALVMLLGIIQGKIWCNEKQTGSGSLI